MEKIKKVLLVILLLIFSAVMSQCARQQKTSATLAISEKGPETRSKIYFNNGKVIQCDMVWEGVESNILCQKSDNITAYSACDVDLRKTFGKTVGEEIAQRYEAKKRYRELITDSTTLNASTFTEKPEKVTNRLIKKHLSKICKSWMGHSVYSLARKWGLPFRTIDLGVGSIAYVYEKKTPFKGQNLHWAAQFIIDRVEGKIVGYELKIK